MLNSVDNLGLRSTNLHVWSRAISVHNFQWLLDTGLAKVPILVAVQTTEFVLQGKNIHVLIIIEMTEPSEIVYNLVQTIDLL